MKYMLLLRHEPDTGPAENTPEFDAEMAKWGEVMGALGQTGSVLAAHGLDTEATATTVRIRNDEALISDGPFAESKESFFSYIIIDVADLDAALGWAKKMPNVTYGSVELTTSSSGSIPTNYPRRSRSSTTTSSCWARDGSPPVVPTPPAGAVSLVAVGPELTQPTYRRRVGAGQMHDI